LNTALPQRLKQRALRQLWKLNPALANLDGLIDYGEDFTDSATVIDDLQTTYQVGKGMLRHIEAMAAKDEDEELADDTVDLDPAEEVEAESPTPVAALDDAPEDEVTLAALPQSSVEPVATVDEAQLGVSHARRRMQFHFEDAS